MSEKYQISDGGSDGWELTKRTGNKVAILAERMVYDDASDVLRELNTLAAENARLREALEALLHRDQRNTCQHCEVHRGGLIWTICDACGQRWADDMNPYTPFKEPPEWTQAYAALKK